MNFQFSILNFKKYPAIWKLGIWGLFGIWFCVFGALYSAHAQESLSLTVTPPLFQLNMSPGDFWASTIRVVNTNPYDLVIYADVLDFEAVGEEGHGRFVPVLESETRHYTHSLATWIEIPRDAVVIPPGQSKEIGFSIRVPEDAEAGGRYAGILVGTRPPENGGRGSVVRVSSLVSSLVFVRIGGDVIEEGRIRDFFSDKSVYGEPHALFTLRFENTGNVHLLPQGEIVITNMWGKERGRIPINQKTFFGSVLPESIRKFTFTWDGEGNFFEAGRYKAEATLAFGGDARQNISRAAYFWIIPVKPVAGLLGGITFFIAVMFFAIRAYIRRALALHQERLGLTPGKIPAYSVHTVGQPPMSASFAPQKDLRLWAEPMRRGIIDLRRAVNAQSVDTPSNTASPNPAPLSRSKTIANFTKKYRFALLVLLIFTGGIWAALVYFGNVLEGERPYSITIERNGG